MLLWAFREHKLRRGFYREDPIRSPVCWERCLRTRPAVDCCCKNQMIKSDFSLVGPVTRLRAPPISTRAESGLTQRPSAPCSSTPDLRQTATSMKDTQRWDQRKRGWAGTQGARDEKKKMWKGQNEKNAEARGGSWVNKWGEEEGQTEEAQQEPRIDKVMKSTAAHGNGTCINNSQLAFRILIDCRAIIFLYFI